jgi:hypothetical protein
MLWVSTVPKASTVTGSESNFVDETVYITLTSAADLLPEFSKNKHDDVMKCLIYYDSIMGLYIGGGQLFCFSQPTRHKVSCRGSIMLGCLATSSTLLWRVDRGSVADDSQLHAVPIFALRG